MRITMSSSATANLFYGYVFNQESVYPWLDEDDYEKNESFTERGWEPRDYYAHFALDKTEDEVDELNGAQEREIQEGMLVEVCSWGCLYEQPCYYIRPKDKKAEYNCWWDGPQKISPAEMIVNPEWDVALRGFAEAMKIDLRGQEPAWHLVASYG